MLLKIEQYFEIQLLSTKKEYEDMKKLKEGKKE